MVTVRDLNSYNLLKKWGVSAVLTSDPVWDIESSSQKTTTENKKVVGIQLREWLSMDKKRLESLSASVVDNFDNDNTELVVIPLQPAKDTKISEELFALLKANCKNAQINILRPESIEDSINALNNLDYLIAMRFHAELIAIKFAVPTIALCYDPKVESISKEAGVPYVWIEDISEEKLNEKINEMLLNENELKEQLQTFSTKKAVESRQNRDLLLKILVGK